MHVTVLLNTGKSRSFTADLLEGRNKWILAEVIIQRKRLPQIRLKLSVRAIHAKDIQGLFK